MKKATKSFETNSSWYGSEPEIPQSAITETFDTEILICGAGVVGMSGAIFAGKRGAKTLIIEKGEKVGLIKTYMGAINTKAQKALGDKARIDKEEIIEELVNYSTKYTEDLKIYGDYKRSKYLGTNKVDEKLVRLWADESGATFDELADELSEYGIKHVCEYDIGHGHHGVFKTFPIQTKLVAPFRKGGLLATQHAGVYVLEKFFFKKAKSYGVKFMFNTTLVKVVKERNKVVGAIAKKKDGKFIRINATKGVLIGTGGYVGNDEWLERLNPEAVSVSTLRQNQKGNTGDGIKVGIWAGGEKDKYPSAMLFDRGPIKPGGRSGAPIKYGQTFDAFFFGSQPFMKVNMEGKRYTNEYVPYDVVLYPLQDQKNGVACIIWDANYWKHVKAFHTVGCSRMLPSKSKPKTYEGMGFLANYAFLMLHRFRGKLKKSNTIEGLAKKLMLPPEELKATVERYNQMAELGEDKDFGRPGNTLFPIKKPPYYGITNAGWMMTTMDGLRINTNIQVVDKNGNAIEGLYAAGDVAGGFFGDNLYPELCVGIAAGKTTTFTRHAILHMTGSI